MMISMLQTIGKTANRNIFIQISAAKVGYNKGVVSADPHQYLDICNLRLAVDSALANLNGVQWVLSAIGGERNRRGGEDSFHIEALVGYTQTSSTKGSFINAVMHDIGLSVTNQDHKKNDNKMAKYVVSIANLDKVIPDNTPRYPLVNTITTVFKYYISKSGRSLELK